jgi:hypothetical protein
MRRLIKIEIVKFFLENVEIYLPDFKHYQTYF